MPWICLSEESSKLPLHQGDRLITQAGQVLEVLSVYNGRVMLQPEGMGDSFAIPVADALKLEKAPPLSLQSTIKEQKMNWLIRQAADPYAVRIPQNRITKEQLDYLLQHFAVAADTDSTKNELIIRFAPELQAAMDQWLRDQGIYSSPDID